MTTAQGNGEESTMGRGTWDDFTSKWGFNDGATVDRRDFEARSRLIEMLNENPAMQQGKLRAVAYDRPGLHNCCMIVVLPVCGQSDEELLSLWKCQGIDAQSLPSALDIDELVGTAYEE